MSVEPGLELEAELCGRLTPRDVDNLVDREAARLVAQPHAAHLPATEQIISLGQAVQNHLADLWMPTSCKQLVKI